jgi:hypothetical protein
MWSLGAVAGAGWPNSGEVSPEPGRRGWGSGLGFTGGRFVGWMGQGTAPASGSTGGQRHWPPRPCWGRGWASPEQDGGGGHGKEGVGECTRESERTAFIHRRSRTVPQGMDRRSSERADHGTTSQDKHVVARTPRRLGARGPQALRPRDGAASGRGPATRHRSSTASGRGPARGSARDCQDVPVCLCSTTCCQKFLNKSARCGQ